MCEQPAWHGIASLSVRVHPLCLTVCISVRSPTGDAWRLSIWCGFDLSSIVRDGGSWWWRALGLELKLSSFSVLGRARGNRDTERQALVVDLAVASSQRSSPGVSL